MAVNHTPSDGPSPGLEGAAPAKGEVVPRETPRPVPVNKPDEGDELFGVFEPTSSCF